MCVCECVYETKQICPLETNNSFAGERLLGMEPDARNAEDSSATYFIKLVCRVEIL